MLVINRFRCIRGLLSLSRIKNITCNCTRFLSYSDDGARHPTMSDFAGIVENDRVLDALSKVSNSNDNDNKPVVRISPQHRLRISDILATKNDSQFTMSHDLSIEDAVIHLSEQRLASCVTLDKNGEVSGIFTARDILRHLYNKIKSSHTSKQAIAPVDGVKSRITAASQFLSAPLLEIITKKEKLVYCSPMDTVRKVRELMFQCRVRNIPVIEKNELLGMVSIKDLADSAFSLIDSGGKKGFIYNIEGRKGLPMGTRVNMDGDILGLPHKNKDQIRLTMEMASYALPHPYKNDVGVAHNRRQYGASELSTDMALCEGEC